MVHGSWMNDMTFNIQFWLIGRMLKSLCNHELSVVIIIIVVTVIIITVIVICDLFSYTHTESKKVPSLHVVALSYNFTSTKVHFCMSYESQLWNLFHCNWHAWNLSVCCIWPSKYKGKWCFSPKCVFSEMDHLTALKFVPLQSACLKTSGCIEFWPSKYKGKSCFNLKCVFSETDHHTALKLYHCDQHTWKPQVVLHLAL